MDAKTLRERAAQARRLLQLVGNEATAHKLRGLADEYERKAAELEAEEGAVSRESRPVGVRPKDR